MPHYAEDVQTFYTIRFAPVGHKFKIYKKPFDSWLVARKHWKDLSSMLMQLSPEKQRYFVIEFYINDLMFERRTNKNLYKIYLPMIGKTAYFFSRKRAIHEAFYKKLDGYFVLVYRGTENGGWLLVSSMVPTYKAKAIQQEEKFRAQELIIRPNWGLSLISGRNYATNY